MIGADAIVVDLANIPGGETAAAMRAKIAAWLADHSEPVTANKAFARWVRIKPLDAPLWQEDLVAIMAGAPDGVILPKTSGPEQIRQLASEIYEIEQKLGLAHNSTKIIPQIGETPQSVLTLGQLTQDPAPRLAGFTWNAEGLARNLGAKRTQDANWHWTDVMRHVRMNVLLLAKAMGVMAIETSTIEAANSDGGADEARAAKCDGFAGMGATHPRQIAEINKIFALSVEERAKADALISHFSSEKAAQQAAKLIQPVELAPEPEPEPEPQRVRAIG